MLGYAFTSDRISAFEAIDSNLRALSLSSFILCTFLRDCDLGDEALGPLTTCILGDASIASGSISESRLPLEPFEG